MAENAAYAAGPPVIPTHHPHMLRCRENKTRIKNSLLCRVREAVAVSLLFKSRRAEAQVGVTTFLMCRGFVR